MRLRRYGLFSLTIRGRWPERREHVDEPLPLRRLAWQPEAQPCRLLGKTADENSGAAELIEELRRRRRAHQAEQRGASGDVEASFHEQRIEPLCGRNEALAGLPNPAGIGERGRADRERRPG